MTSTEKEGIDISIFWGVGRWLAVHLAQQRHTESGEVEKRFEEKIKNFVLDMSCFLWSWDPQVEKPKERLKEKYGASEEAWVNDTNVEVNS